MHPGKIRIIAGQWRGRKLSVPVSPGLRPTADRLRETLFNWLAPWVNGARCLDLFAGSGALGLEAASRGAASVLLVERDPAVAQHLRQQLAPLNAPQVSVLQTDALAFLRGPPQGFDLVFLDPPFGLGLLEPCCARLAESGWLNPGAQIYLEMERDIAEAESLPLPPGWRVRRRQFSREVGCWLVQTEVAAA